MYINEKKTIYTCHVKKNILSIYLCIVFYYTCHFHFCVKGLFSCHSDALSSADQTGTSWLNGTIVGTQESKGNVATRAAKLVGHVLGKSVAT